MDEYSGKRAANGLVVSRKTSGLVLRETPSNRDINSQFCNRVGCSGRLNSAKVTQAGNPKPVRASVRPSCGGKTTIGSSSSRTCPLVNNVRKSSVEPRRKLSSHLESDSSETSSLQDEPEASVLTTRPGKTQRPLVRESKNTQSRGVSLMEVGSSSVASNTRSLRNSNQKTTGLGNRATFARISSSSEPGSTSTSVKSNSGPTRYGLRNLRCSSISDIVPSNCSSSDSSVSKSEAVKRRNPVGESSSATRGKKISGSTTLERNPSSNSLSISDSRKGRYMAPNRDNDVAASVRPRRPIVSQTRARISEQGSGNRSSTAITQRSYPSISIDTSSTGSSHLSSSEYPLARPTSYGRSASGTENVRGATAASSLAEGFSRSLANRDGLRRFNIDGIAEVLLALERIENDEELTFEQLLTLETNLFPNGLNLYDQHRDMRLDIDDMSYEELLALEERMGNVSTALSEEALSECLTRSIYRQSTPLEQEEEEDDEEEEEEEEEEIVYGGTNNEDNDDVKCSVCQEEYVEGDEIGRLRCEHEYHAGCIQQWLRHKNWCPICKAAAAPPPATSTSA